MMLKTRSTLPLSVLICMAAPFAAADCLHEGKDHDLFETVTIVDPTAPAGQEKADGYAMVFTCSPVVNLDNVTDFGISKMPDSKKEWVPTWLGIERAYSAPQTHAKVVLINGDSN